MSDLGKPSKVVRPVFMFTPCCVVVRVRYRDGGGRLTESSTALRDLSSSSSLAFSVERSSKDFGVVPFIPLSCVVGPDGTVGMWMSSMFIL